MSLVKNVAAVLLGLTLAVVLGWLARGLYQTADSLPTEAPRVEGVPHSDASWTLRAEAAVSGEPECPPLQVEPTEPVVPPELLAPIAESTTAAPPPKVSIVAAWLAQGAAPRPIIVPIAGLDRTAIRDMFDEGRGDHRHQAIDIMAPRGTPVIAADDGVVRKLFTSVAGGLTVYEFDPDERFCYYYAHLDRYAAGLHEGQKLRRGQVLGYVGSSGNASKDAPHLHFALIRLDPDKRWWKGTYVNPYPLLVGAQSR